jgi:hypothetical protein
MSAMDSRRGAELAEYGEWSGPKTDSVRPVFKAAIQSLRANSTRSDYSLGSGIVLR